VQWLLMAGVVLYILTGLGMTQFGIFEQVPLGLPVRRACVAIHNNLIIPFVILLLLHLLLPYIRKWLNHSQQPGSPGCPQQS
jgi:thiosulfate reductase cytochrome b subunit